MKRLLVACAALAASACLEPGNPVYLKADSTPPVLLSSNPAIFGSDAGAPMVQAGQVIELTFSEEMDSTSLRAGIAVRKTSSREEQPLVIIAPPPTDGDDEPDVRTSPYTVRISAGQGMFQTGTHSITLRSLLIDLRGNALANEQTAFFTVP